MRGRRAALVLGGVGAVAVLGAVLLAVARPDGDACGDPVEKAGGGTWECTFVEEFDGDRLDPDVWLAQETESSGFDNGGECFVDDPDNVAVGDGVLRLTVRKEPAPFLCPDTGGPRTTQATAGSVSTYQRFSQAYGRFEVRARFPASDAPGLHSAIWLWPDDPTAYGAWPLSGEIDVAEYYTSYPDRVIPYLHYQPSDPGQEVTDNACLVERPDRFHTYLLEWTKESIVISYDGEVCVENRWDAADPLPGRAPFDKPFMVALTQALGAAGNGYVEGRTPLPATTEVDHVKVWR